MVRCNVVNSKRWRKHKDFSLSYTDNIDHNMLIRRTSTCKQSTVCGTSMVCQAKLLVSTSSFSHMTIGRPSRAVTCCNALVHFYKHTHTRKSITIRVRNEIQIIESSSYFVDRVSGEYHDNRHQSVDQR